MIKRISYVFTILFTIMFIVSCGIIDPTNIKFEVPEMSLDSFTVKNVTLEKTEFTLILNVANKNAIGGSIKKIEYQVDLNKVEKFIVGTTTNPIEIKANELKNKIEIPITVENSKVPSLITNMTADSFTSVPYKISGKVYFDALLTEIPVPFNFEGNIDITSIIKFVTSSFSTDSGDILGAILKAFLPQ